jgi:hypothetical protein
LNLQKQFEKGAAEAGMSAKSKYETGSGLENENSLEATPVNPPKINQEPRRGNKRKATIRWRYNSRGSALKKNVMIVIFGNGR